MLMRDTILSKGIRMPRLAVSRRLVGLFLFALGLQAAGQMPAVAQERPSVVVSFTILADLVSAIGGERVDVTTIVGPGGDAHAFQPSPTDARAVAEADLVVINGLGFEGWFDRLISATRYGGVTLVASEGVVPLSQDADAFGAQAGDPHAWQNVANARIYVANIANALIRADPGGASLYAANLIDYGAKLDELEDEIISAIGGIPEDHRTVVTSHDAFGYFAAAYSLVFVSPQGINPDALPGARGAADLIRQINADGIDAVFVEALADARLIEQIARETGAAIGGALYSDTLSAIDGPASTYLSMMRHNLNTLVSALSN